MSTERDHITRIPSTFGDCLITCLQDEKMVNDFDQLYGTDVCALLDAASPLERSHTRSHARSLAMFTLFVYDTVWMRGEGK